MTRRSGWERLGPWVALLAAISGAALMIDANPREAQAQGRADVAIVDVAYQPGSILVQAGDTVTWTNSGSTPHTVTADDGSVDSGPLAPSASFSQTFPAAGLFTYHCAIHPRMTGAVTITRAPDVGGGTPVHQVPRTGTGTPVATEPVVALALGAAVALGIGAVIGRLRTR
jgi:plastocyanin